MIEEAYWFFGLIAVGVVALWWLIMCGVIAGVARERGRSAVGFFLLAMAMSPFFAVLVLIAAPDRAAEARRKAEHEPEAEAFLQAINSVWKELEAIRVRLGSPPPVVKPPQQPPLRKPAAATVPQVGAGMGYCPECLKLRLVASPVCVHCGSDQPVPRPVQPNRGPPRLVK